MRRTVALVTIALAGALTASDAAGTVCLTGRPEVYAGCTVVVVVPGTFCYVWSSGTVAGTPYAVGPYRC